MVKITIEIDNELNRDINIEKAILDYPNKRQTIIHMLKEYIKQKKPSFWGLK